MPVRLISVGDQHFDSVAPSSRKDNYLESLQLKVQEIRQLAIDYQAHGVIWLGDLLHKQDGHRVPYSVTNWLLGYFGSYPDSIKNYLLMGNHDVKATSQNWRRQPIGTLVTAGVVEPLWDDVTDDNPWGSRNVVEYGDGDCTIEISGKQFSYECDTPANRGSFYARWPRAGDDSRFHLQACHAAVVPVGESTFGHFSTPDQIRECVRPGEEAALYLCGHLHDFYGSFQSTDGSIRFVNLGSLARGSIDEYNLKRKVKVGLVTVSGGAVEVCSVCGEATFQTESGTACRNGHGGADVVLRQADPGQQGYKVSLEEYDLKSVKPAEEIFEIKEFQRKKSRIEELERLAVMLNAGTIADEFRIINADESLEVVLRSTHVRPEVEKLVRDKVRAAKADLES